VDGKMCGEIRTRNNSWNFPEDEEISLLVNYGIYDI
jgi:hypothetical protein